jgi:hypothetical protein
VNTGPSEQRILAVGVGCRVASRQARAAAAASGSRLDFWLPQPVDCWDPCVQKAVVVALGDLVVLLTVAGLLVTVRRNAARLRHCAPACHFGKRAAR